MNIIRKSPFKVDKIESNPQAYGLRKDAIIDSIQALYNNQSILISGSRGIGKSSFGCQLQKVMQGDSTLLERCDISVEFSYTLCTYHTCDINTTLHQLVADILFGVEKALKDIYYKTDNKFFQDIQLNLGFFKAKINTDMLRINQSPGTIASEFIKGTSEAMNILRSKNCDYNICIMIDEIDQLSPDINFGHFIKIVHEQLGREDLEEVTFIFAGQSGVFSRFTKEDASFERIVLHVPINTLDKKASKHILEYAKDNCKPSFIIEQTCEDMIIALSSGYPYYIHLLGNEAFLKMSAPDYMNSDSLLIGLDSLLRAGKFEKYMERLKNLDKIEQGLIIKLSEYTSNSVPIKIPYKWIVDSFGKEIDITVEKVNRKISTLSIIKSLISKEHLKVSEDIITKKKYIVFNDELFRVFISLRRFIRHDAYLKKVQEKQAVNKVLNSDVHEKYDPIIALIQSGELENMLQDASSPEEKEAIAEQIYKSLAKVNYETDNCENYWTIGDSKDIEDMLYSS
jgi:hypothetical protein